MPSPSSKGCGHCAPGRRPDRSGSLWCTCSAASSTRRSPASRALPPSDAALTFLGIALSRQGAQAEARDILTDVIASAPDTPFAALAREALG